MQRLVQRGAGLQPACVATCRWLTQRRLDLDSGLPGLENASTVLRLISKTVKWDNFIT
jgi:hypothetical protein